MKLEDLSKVVYEATRAHAEATSSDYRKPAWDKASDDVKRDYIARVQQRLELPNAPASALHDQWLVSLLFDGWTYGEVLNKERKQHPKLLPFSKLPKVEQEREVLFARIVEALR